MKKKKIIIISASVVVAGIVAYYIYDNMRSKRRRTNVIISEEEDIIKEEVKPIETTYDTYIVSTKTSNLNIRQSPDVNSKILDRFVKGSVVYARKTNNDWYEVSIDGINSIGFVSAKYLTKQ